MAHYSSQFSIARLWLIFAAAMIVMFGALLYFGAQIYQSKPPIPAVVQTTSGGVIYTRADIERGQNVWQSMGGMEQGSIWGHGGYVAPDWSADWLHREALAVLDIWAREEGAGDGYASLSSEQQAALRGRLETHLRHNSYDAATATITLDAARAKVSRADAA